MLQDLKYVANGNAGAGLSIDVVHLVVRRCMLVCERENIPLGIAGFPTLPHPHEVPGDPHWKARLPKGVTPGSCRGNILSAQETMGSQGGPLWKARGSKGVTPQGVTKGKTRETVANDSTLAEGTSCSGVTRRTTNLHSRTFLRREQASQMAQSESL